MLAVLMVMTTAVSGCQHRKSQPPLQCSIVAGQDGRVWRICRDAAYAEYTELPKQLAKQLTPAARDRVPAQ